MNRVERTCTEIVRYLVHEGFTNQISEPELNRAIIRLRGADDRTVRNWTRALVELDFLERTTLFVFTINLVKVPDLLTEAVKKGQVKLM